MKKMLLALTLVAFTGACATDPYTGEERVARTAYGTGIGAAVGAGVGALVGGSKGAAWGAGIGAATGAAAGGYMDYQASELRKELTGTGVQISDNNGIISLIMPGNITFDTDVYTIKSSFKPVLDSIAKVINKYDQTNIQIVGHTDNVGSRDYNLQLSLKRATSVSTYLKLRDVAAARIGTYGAGPDMPIADNSTAAGREQNRRVEIQLINVSK